MIYKLTTTDKFDRAFKKLDRQTQKIIKAWIDKNLMHCENPRQHGKALNANMRGKWRYRIGDYRILAEIREQELVLVLINIGHRSSIYS